MCERCCQVVTRRQYGNCFRVERKLGVSVLVILCCYYPRKCTLNEPHYNPIPSGDMRVSPPFNAIIPFTFLKPLRIILSHSGDTVAVHLLPIPRPLNVLHSATTDKEPDSLHSTFIPIAAQLFQ